MEVENPLAYYAIATVTAVKSLAIGSNVLKKFTTVIYEFLLQISVFILGKPF
jgi:hypothetical protein